MTTTFLKNYKVLEKIGEGSFSEVLKCQNRENGGVYAAKRLKKIYQNISEMLESPEVITMQKITRHPNILYLIESHYDPAPGKVTLIFELMDMSLYDLVNGRKGRLLTEQRVKVFLYQLLKGLEHLHKHGIFHRDIKPENILVKGNVVKLADLGSIRGIYSRPPYTEYISTRWYRSPECLLTRGFYGPKMDVWATGCVYYELLTLKPLFPGSNEVDQIAKIFSVLGTPHARLLAKFRSGFGNLLPHVVEGGRDILKLMLVHDPENRSNVKRLLDHRYFNDLREKESPRKPSFVVVPNSSRESTQWRNPVLLSYITSERRRKSAKASRLHRPKLYNDADESWSKIPRVVASSPNASRLSNNNNNNNNSGSKFQKSANATADATLRKKLGVYATRTQLNISSTSKSIDKLLPPIKYASKTACMSLQPVASLPLQRSYGGISKSETKAVFKRASPSCNSFLPQITLKSSVRKFGSTTGSAPSQNLTGKRFETKTKLATITETSEKMAHRCCAKSPNAKSPAKKMAKHEISTPLDCSLAPMKKLKASLSKENVRRGR